MLSWIRDHFLPHERNGNVPHLFSVQSFFVLVSMVMACEIAFLLYVVTVVPSAHFLGEVLPNVLIDLTNQDRAVAGVSQLATNDLLVQAARLKAQDMALHGYFAHTSPTGITPWHWLGEVGYQYESAGENLAINFVDSVDVERAWMASPSHHANIVNNGFSQIGIATAVGVYEGRQAVFVVQFFGRPSRQVGVVEDKNNTPSISGGQNVQEQVPPQIKTGTVAGSEVQQNTTTKPQMAVITKNKPTIANSQTVPSVQTSDNQALSNKESNSLVQFFQKSASNPQTATMVLLLTIATLLLAALGINLVISKHHIHSHVLLRGTALVGIIAIVLTFNAMLPIAKTVIPAIAHTQTLF